MEQWIYARLYDSVMEIMEKANEWLNTEQHDFRTREFITKTEAKRLGYQLVKM